MGRINHFYRSRVKKESVYLMRCFILGGYFFSLVFLTALPSFLMFLVQDASGSVDVRFLGAFPDAASGGGEIIMIWARSFSTNAYHALVKPTTPFPFLSVLLVTRLNLLPLFASPRSSCCDALNTGGKFKHREQIIPVPYMCRYALRICVFSLFRVAYVCVSASEFLQRQSVPSLSPSAPRCRVAWSILRLTGCIDVVGHGESQARFIIGNLRGAGREKKFDVGMN